MSCDCPACRIEALLARVDIQKKDILTDVATSTFTFPAPGVPLNGNAYFN